MFLNGELHSRAALRPFLGHWGGTEEAAAASARHLKSLVWPGSVFQPSFEADARSNTWQV